MIVRTATVAFPACLASVADEFLVHEFHVFVQPILTDACTLALWAGVPSTLVGRSNVLKQLLSLHETHITALAYVREIFPHLRS